MKTSYNFLKRYVDIDVTPQVLCDKMVMAGFEVEEIIDTSLSMNNVVVGKITDIKKHEDSDHLQICQVNVGNETVQIVTGASNVFVGATVPVAQQLRAGAAGLLGANREVAQQRGVPCNCTMTLELFGRLL